MLTPQNLHIALGQGIGTPPHSNPYLKVLPQADDQMLCTLEAGMTPTLPFYMLATGPGELGSGRQGLLHVRNRDFQAAVPNEKWLTDITEFQIPAGKVYLSPIIDCFDGMVVSWTIGTSPDAELVNTMLDAAIETVAETTDRPVVHSDRGGHYRWPGWLSRMSDANFTRSMSRKACSPDNAACEGFFGRLKNELFYPRDWKNATIEQFIEAVDSYIRWYNEKRIKISLGSLSPIEYRESLGLAT